MLRSILTAKTGLSAQQDALDAISNNLANTSTTAYKQQTVNFTDSLYRSLRESQNYPQENDIGTGVEVSSVYTDDSQGSLTETGVATNLAISGSGYFKVISSTGEEYYTRDGSFTVDGNGRIVDSNGNFLEIDYEDGYSADNVTFTSSNYTVSSDGSVYLSDGTKVGTIHTYDAVGDGAFTSIGNNLYELADGSEAYVSDTATIYQGYLEDSNVDLATELTSLITTQKAYQLSSKALTTADEMWQMVNQLRS